MHQLHSTIGFFQKIPDQSLGLLYRLRDEFLLRLRLALFESLKVDIYCTLGSI